MLPGPAADPDMSNSTGSEALLEGSSSPDTASEAGLMDWREEIRQASDLPEVGANDSVSGVGWAEEKDVDCRER